MKKILPYLIVILISSCTNRETATELWPSGTLKSQGELLDGNKEGRWVFFHKSSPDTSYIEYYKSGKPYQIDRYEYISNWPNQGDSPETTILTERATVTSDNIKNGPYILYHPSGFEECKGTYAEGRQNGVETCVYETGETSTVTTFADDEVGEFKQYWPNGNLLLTAETRGNGIHYAYDSTGTLTYKLFVDLTKMKVDTVETYTPDNT